MKVVCCQIIACQDCSSLEAWVCHLQGAATLIRHWTEEDWKRPIGVRAFFHFFYLLVLCPLFMPRGGEDRKALSNPSL